MTDLSITFCSFRMLPGQLYDRKSSTVFLSIDWISLPARFA
jgi:hypothetical protein